MDTGDGFAAGFGPAVHPAGEQAVLAIRDEHAPSAGELGASLDAAIASGYVSVVLDLADLDLIDGAGLAVLASAGHRLAAIGGHLTIRSPSSVVGRILSIGGLAEVALLVPSEAATGHLAAEQPADPPGELVPASYSSARHPRRITFIPSDDDAVDSALRLVVALARATVGGADGVSISLRRHGRLATVAASDQTILDMDADQYATKEGPCVDASVKGRWFHSESLAAETRWPAFVPRARTLGISAILSSPLLARERPVGALNIYSRSAAAFARRDQELASIFASEASIVLTAAGADVTDDQLASRLREAQETRQTIARAEGVVMEREGISGEDAYTWLRRSSLGLGRPLREQAEDVVGSTAGRPDREPGPPKSRNG